MAGWVVVRSLVLFHHHKFSQPTSKSIRGKRKQDLGKENIYTLPSKERAIKSIQRHLLKKTTKIEGYGMVIPIPFPKDNTFYRSIAIVLFALSVCTIRN